MTATIATPKLDIETFSEADRDALRRAVSLNHAVEVIDRGTVIARLESMLPEQLDVPLTREEELRAWWNEHDLLAAEISDQWPEGVSAEDAIRDVRRDP